MLKENKNSMNVWRFVRLQYLVGIISSIILGVLASLYPELTLSLVVLAVLLVMILCMGIPREGVRLYLSVWMIVLVLYVLRFRVLPDFRVMIFLIFTSLAFIIGNFLIEYVHRFAPKKIVELNAKEWHRILFILELIGIILVSYQVLLATKTLGLRPSTFVLMINWRQTVPNLKNFTFWSRGFVAYGLFFAYFGCLLSISLRRFGIKIPICHTILNGLLVIISISVAAESFRRNYVYEMMTSAFFIWIFALPKKQYRKIFCIALVIASILVFSFTQTQRILNKSRGGGLQDILDYITLNLENAEDALEHKIVFGQRSFYLLSLILEKLSGGRLKAPNFWDPANERLNWYNTLPYFAEWAADVGLLGSILMSLIWGIATAFVARYAQRSPLWLVIHGLLQTSIVFSFRSNFVSSFSFWFLTLIAVGVAFMVKGPIKSISLTDT